MQAMSHRPVACLLIVVQARARISNVLDEIMKYAEGFEPKEFTDIIAVGVTHMDTITDWDEGQFRAALSSQTGINKVVFSWPAKPFMQLEEDILSVSNQRPVNIQIDSENFLRFFKIGDRNYKIMRSVRREVDRFEAMKKWFYFSNDIFRHPENVNVDQVDPDTIDMLFEFQAWMTESITDAQKRVSEENGFLFIGPNMAYEAGHIANSTNQLKAVLLELRTRCLHFTASHGVNELRRCPHCGLIWAKVVGCGGQTTCGALVNSVDVNARRGAHGRHGVMATFTFLWDEVKGALSIIRRGQRQAKSARRRCMGRGCGNPIYWSTMAVVPVPPEFCATQEVQVGDVDSLPAEKKKKWEESFKARKSEFQVKEAPYPPPRAGAGAPDELGLDRRASPLE